jgi:predicted phage terminase large subunit-like protein
MHAGLELPERALPVPPYTLGVWLGDGRSSCGFITQGEEDREHILARIKAEGFVTRPHKDERNIGILGLHVLLKKYGLLNNKHIPPEYLRASRKQRIALLQGLIDTDGHVAPDGQVEFCTTNERLARDVTELVRSLGVKCTVIQGTATLNGRICGRKWRVMFYFSEAASLPRKRERCKNGTRFLGNYITIEPAGYADTVCIEVDHPSHLFLVGEGMLPTHNSETTTVKFPAWYLGRHPDRRVIIASHTASLAARFSMRARNDFAQFAPEVWGLEVNPDVSAMYRWDVLDKNAPPGQPPGGMIAAGIGGPITGQGAHLAIIDDPVKDAEAANSKVQRDAVWDWYRFVLRTRLFPGAAVILVLTRWHEDDLAGRLLRQAGDDSQADQWVVLRLPALAEENDPLGRQPGEALWPEQYDEKALEATKASVGSYVWAALYQQRPQPAEGGIFKRKYFRYYRTEAEWYTLHRPEGDKRVPKKDCWIFQTCDPAGSTKTTADYFVLGTWALTPDRELLLLDLIRERLEGPDQINLFRQAYLRFKPAVQAVESRGLGLTLYQMLLREGLPVVELKAETDKVTRALPAAARMQAGMVYFPKSAPWLGEYEAELLAFPSGEHDDQVDVTSYAAQIAAWDISDGIQTRAGRAYVLG